MVQDEGRGTSTVSPNHNTITSFSGHTEAQVPSTRTSLAASATRLSRTSERLGAQSGRLVWGPPAPYAALASRPAGCNVTDQRVQYSIDVQ